MIIPDTITPSLFNIVQAHLHAHIDLLHGEINKEQSFEDRNARWDSVKYLRNLIEQIYEQLAVAFYINKSSSSISSSSSSTYR